MQGETLLTIPDLDEVWEHDFHRHRVEIDLFLVQGSFILTDIVTWEAFFIDHVHHALKLIQARKHFLHVLSVLLTAGF